MIEPTELWGFCELCPTKIPANRRRCHFHSTPLARLEHVREHLRPRYRIFLDYFVQPLTFDDIATRLGAGWTRRQVENAWYGVRLQLGLADHSSQLERLALLRVVAGIDECFCRES